MSERILLFIADQAGQTLVWYPPGKAPMHGGWPEFGAFVAAQTGRPSVVVILSDHGVGRLLVPIPSSKRHQALQALPFALEELAAAEDPAQLHVVLAERPLTPGHWPVLLVDAARRTRILEQLEASGVTAFAMVALADLLPSPEPETFTVWREPFTDLIVVVTGPYQGFVLPPAVDGVGDPEARVGAVLARLADRPKQVQFHDADPTGTASPTPEGWPTDIARVSAPAPGEADWPAIWRQGLAGNQPLSAVTPPRQAEARLLQRRWGQVAMVAGVMLGLVMVGQVVSTWQMARQADALQAQVVQDFHAALPQAKRLVNARVQLQQALDQLDAGPERDGFLTTLAAFGKTLHDMRQKDGSLAIQSLRYADHQLTVEITGQQYAALQSLFDRLKTTGGLTVTRVDSGVDDGKAHMRLRLAPMQDSGQATT